MERYGYGRLKIDGDGAAINRGVCGPVCFDQAGTNHAFGCGCEVVCELGSVEIVGGLSEMFVDDGAHASFSGNLLTGAKKDGIGTTAKYRGHRVRHQDNRALIDEFGDFVEALFFEGDIAYGENFVQNQDVRLQMRRNSEPQSDGHSRTVVTNWHIDEFSNLSEIDDFLKFLINLGAGETQQCGPVENVLPAGKDWIETSAQLDKGTYPAANDQTPRIWLQDSAEHFEQRALSSTIWSDHAKALALFELKRNFAKCPEFIGA